MKKLLLPAAILLSGLAVGQNVQDQRVNFGYIQWPSNPINKDVENFSVVLDKSMYEKSNEDSMSIYEGKLLTFETEFETWLEQKVKIDKAHLMALATWEKQVNAGNATLQQPVKPPYPKIPLKEEIMLPLLTEDISDASVDNSMSLEGYTKGEGGAVITVTPLGFQEAKVTMKKTGTGPTTKYQYTTSCKMPIKVTLEVPGQGIVINETIGGTASTENLKTFDSKFEYDVWVIDNWETYWTQKQQKMLNANLVHVKNLINNKCGFPVKQRSTEIYTVKKFKDHNYSDLIDAYSYVKSGYDLLYKDVDKDDGIEKIEKGIKIWEAALEESDVNNSKSRVNKKVTALLYANLAEAYMWIDDFDAADNYMTKAKAGGVAKYKNFAKSLQGVSNGLKTRYLANH